LDGGIVDLGQRRHGKKPISDDADQQHRDHQKGRADGAEDENPRRVHRGLLRILRRGLVRALVARLYAGVRRDVTRVVGLLAGRSSGAVIHISRRVAPILDDPDLRSLAQPVGAVDHDSIVGLQPRCDLDLITVGDAGLNLLNADRIVRLDQEDEGSWGAVLDRRDGGGCRVVERAHQQPSVDELIGKELFVGIGESGAKLDRAGGRIDQVVDAFQGSRGDQLVVRTVVGGNNKLLSGSHFIPYVLDRVLRDDEDDGDRLNLGQHHEPGRVRRLDVVSRIDKAQANPSRDRRNDTTIGEIEFRCLDIRLILLDESLVLLNEEFLIRHLLHGDTVQASERLKSSEVGLSLL
jgi:hypothetical protein